MSMYNFKKCSDIYSRRSGSSLQYYRDRSDLNNWNDFPVDKGNSVLFKIFKKYNMPNSRQWHKYVEIVIPLKKSSNFRGTLEIPLINCETNLIGTWYTNCFIIAGTAINYLQTFVTNDTKRCVLLQL